MIGGYYPFDEAKIVAHLMLTVFHQLEGVYVGGDDLFGIDAPDFVSEVHDRTIYTFHCIIRDDYSLPIDALETMVADYADVSIIHPVVVGYTVEDCISLKNFTRLIVRVSCI